MRVGSPFGEGGKDSFEGAWEVSAHVHQVVLHNVH